MYKTTKNGHGLFFFMDWRKDAIMFLWPLEEEEKLRFFHASKTAENR